MKRGLVVGEVDSVLHINDGGFLAGADPDAIQLLPGGFVLLNREPRSCRKMGALQSETAPKVVEADPLDGAAVVKCL